ncbi:hypothetical protein AbraIFM66950_002294 [Aspergillus brasiliensis]|nr:hypothetical protein AbraIFM66950_002294 [Aspergillus brasiliensis]
MDTNALHDHLNTAQDQLWANKINLIHENNHFRHRVSTFHPEKLPCRLVGTFHHGAFNAGLKMVFTDHHNQHHHSTSWLVRFPRAGIVSNQNTDEKVAMEVSALKLVRERTTIPVPRVWAWGPAASNPLGLGPFIMMEYIEGVGLSDILRDPGSQDSSRMAGFMLQLFNLNFEHIGSLPSPSVLLRDDARMDFTLPRPLTFKAHSILQYGGVDTFGDRTKGFTTTTEYFQYVANQDWEQLAHQPNSTCGQYDAQNKYVAFKVLKTLIPDLVHPMYDHGKFKLICDDLGLANLIVRGKDDLTVVGVVDLEWSYIGPAQLFGSAPWWLLQDRPVNSAWDCNGEEPPEITARYFKYLDMFIQILEEEEAKVPGYGEEELSSLVKWSRTSGAMWLHMLLSSGFNDHRSFPFTMLRKNVGCDKWEKREKGYDNAEELEAFLLRKVSELNQYDEDLEQIEENQALMDSGKMAPEEFVAIARTIIETPGFSY